MTNGKLSWTRDLGVCPGVLGPQRLGELGSLNPWDVAKGVDLVQRIVGSRKKERSHLHGQKDTPHSGVSPHFSVSRHPLLCGLWGESSCFEYPCELKDGWSGYSGVGMSVRRDPSDGSYYGGDGGDKALKGREGQGEAAWKSQQGTQMKVEEPGRPGKAWEGGELCPILMLPLVSLQTETLLLQAERRALCACWPAGR